MATGEHANDQNKNFKAFINKLREKDEWEIFPINLFPKRIKNLIYRLVIILAKQLVDLQNQSYDDEIDSEIVDTVYSDSFKELIDSLKHSN